MMLALLLSVFCILAIGATNVPSVAKSHEIPKFNCTIHTNVPPATTAWKLHPSVVAAIGDSISAGLGAVGITPLEYRQYSFPIGGAKDEATIANYIHNYGGAVGSGKGKTITFTRGKWLDAGISGGIVSDIFEEVDYLLDTMDKEYDIDIQNDWKYINMLMGANDLCHVCDGVRPSNRTIKEQIDFVMEIYYKAIEYTKKIPRAFVNVMAANDIASVAKAAQASFFCRDIVLPYYKGECPCFHKGPEAIAQINEGFLLFNAAVEKMVADLSDRSNPNFALAFNPLLAGVDMSFYGEDYLSNFDCFHPSRLAHNTLTTVLWKNMFVPLSQKDRSYNSFEFPAFCPGPNDFLQ